MTSHKSHCVNVTGTHYNYKVYQFIRANGGWESFYMYSLYRMEFTDILELKAMEQYYIDHYRPDLNGKPALPNLAIYHIGRNAQHTCFCGGRYTYTNKAKHFKSKKHTSHVLEKLMSIVYISEK